MKKPKGYARKPFSNEKNMIEIFCSTIQETEYAVLIDAGLEAPVWLQKSRLEDWPDKGESGEALMHEDYAIEKGLV